MQPFTRNGDYSIEVKILEWDGKLQNKQIILVFYVCGKKRYFQDDPLSDVLVNLHMLLVDCNSGAFFMYYVDPCDKNLRIFFFALLFSLYTK